MGCLLTIGDDEIMDRLLKSINYNSGSVKGNFKRASNAMDTNVA